MSALDKLSPPNKLSLVVFSGTFEKVHYALVMASAALATNRPVTLFFTMGAAKALMADDAWAKLRAEDGRLGGEVDQEFQARGVAGFAELLSACDELGAQFMVCEMGLRALGLDAQMLRGDLVIEPGGVVTFLADASKDGAMLFI